MYATPADLRAEGVTEAMASDERLVALIDEASRSIDQLTGWSFEPRALTLHMAGRGTSTLEPPLPPIRLDRLSVDGAALNEDFIIAGAPIAPGFDAPRIGRREGKIFLRGSHIEAAGLWGYTEADGTALGRTPRDIRRACMLLVLRTLHPLADAASADVRNRWRIIEERTRDQSYRLTPSAPSSLSGDPDVDAILLRYQRPSGLGAA